LTTLQFRVRCQCSAAVELAVALARYEQARGRFDHIHVGHQQDRGSIARRQGGYGRHTVVHVLLAFDTIDRQPVDHEIGAARDLLWAAVGRRNFNQTDQ
jgi:hypothetical protein